MDVAISFDTLLTAGFPSDRRYVGARLERRQGRITKVPYCAFDPTRKASSTDATTWSDFATARRSIEQCELPLLGFVLGDGFVGIDLDHCRHVETGVIDPWALEIVDQLHSYTEVSLSGTGVHVICRGALPAGRNRTGKRGAYPPVPVGCELEMYDAGRYFVMTGHALRPSLVAERTAALGELHARLFRASEGAIVNVDPHAITGREAQHPVHDLPDDELVRRISASAQGEKFSRLWSGDTSLHAQDDSAADLALCVILAFWTRRDAERIDRLFRRSRLYRGKWERRDYRERTIARAMASTREVYDPPLVLSLEDLLDDDTMVVTAADLAEVLR